MATLLRRHVASTYIYILDEDLFNDTGENTKLLKEVIEKEKVTMSRIESKNDPRYKTKALQ